MNGKLEITIKKGTDGSNEFVTRETTSNIPKVNEVGKASPKSQLVMGLATQYAKQLMNEGINVYANVTGNTIQTNQINRFLNITADVALAASGIVGAIAVGFKYTTQAINEQIEIQKAYNKSQFIQSGMGKIVNSYGRYN